jgi:CRISPR-associated protein Cas2
MSTRNVFLLCYDIADPRRLRRVFKVAKGFGVPMQYSVFRCALSPSDLILLMEKLEAEIHHREDHILLVDLGPERGRGEQVFRSLGRAMPRAPEGPVII